MAKQTKTSAPSSKPAPKGRRQSARPIPTPEPITPVTALEGTANRVTKQGQLIAMLQRDEGASIAELAAATGWQAHSVRGVISGVLKKKLGLTLASELSESRRRVYRIQAAG